jgi:hypothetical protein
MPRQSNSPATPSRRLGLAPQRTQTAARGGSDRDFQPRPFPPPRGLRTMQYYCEKGVLGDAVLGKLVSCALCCEDDDDGCGIARLLQIYGT